MILGQTEERVGGECSGWVRKVAGGDVCCMHVTQVVATAELWGAATHHLVYFAIGGLDIDIVSKQLAIGRI